MKFKNCTWYFKMNKTYFLFPLIYSAVLPTGFLLYAAEKYINTMKTRQEFQISVHAGTLQSHIGVNLRIDWWDLEWFITY